MTPLTITCVWVRGNVPYGVEYVDKLASMARRHAPPHRFVCLTDRPEQMPAGVEGIRIPPPAPLAGWWSKLRCFDDKLGLTGRVVYLDLDTIILSSLDPIIDFPAPFALIPSSGTFEGKGALKVVKRFNSSVMVWDAGVPGRLFRTWVPQVAERLWGDQDWIGEQMPDAAAMPITWFPRLSEVHNGPPPYAKVVLAKVPKNHIAAATWLWVAEAWR